MEPEDLKKLSKEQRESISLSELRSVYHVVRNDASIMKIALKIYDNLSDNSKSINDVAREIGTKPTTASTYRGILLKYGVVERKTTPKTGSAKKLQTQKSKGQIYRFPYINKEEMKAANLVPEKDYFAVLVPGNKEITIKFFEQNPKKQANLKP